MPGIPEDFAMDEFVDWEANAELSTASANIALPPGTNLDLQPLQDNQDFDLALANIDGDDFSFWALEHFETSTFNLGNVQIEAATQCAHDVASLQLSDFQKAPCDACQAGGFTCKRIKEGRYKGHCTSCVALRHNCSFGLASSSDGTVREPFPSKPWPTLGEHGSPLPEDAQPNKVQSISSPDLASLTAGAEFGEDPSPKPPAVPKIGARFSRESVRILKAWLSTHTHRPYPTEEERESLQRQTGLNKTQISNWLANARRRSKGKYQPTRSTSPSVRGWTGAIEIPQRRGTPAPEHMNPLQRWENSPPENEPASVTAIASAVLQSNSSYGSGLNSPYSLDFTDDDAARSCKGSSASSFGTSPSSGSFASAFSHHSRGSLGSLGSFQQRGSRRRRRRTALKQSDEQLGLNASLKTFQCTFCTETFRTKHDWQRHEKSLHLSLERWVCCPKGSRALNPDVCQICCVFCGLVDPDNDHIEDHNFTACQERQLDERTFYRKDHLRQHLKLVHNMKYLNWSMDSWKLATPAIRSRCGFCGLILDSWPVRVDHLAEHFKAGFDMKDWKGDWGFEPAVLSMVENALPPYMITEERTAPLPYQASQQSPESLPNAYELIKLELAFYTQNVRDATGTGPSDDELQHEACRIIYSSESISKSGLASQASWLRDLLMSSGELKLKAQMGPIRGIAENCLEKLKINGKDNIFEGCPVEKQLIEYVKARKLLGLTATDFELQVEACNIVGRLEESSIMPSEDVANFLLRLIYKDPPWLSSFRQRAGLPISEEPLMFKGKGTLDSKIYNYSQLEHELAEFARNQRAMGLEPSDDELRKRARCVVYKCSDSWKQTAADNAEWLDAFKQRHLQQQTSRVSASSSSNSPQITLESLIPGMTTTRESPHPADATLDLNNHFAASPFPDSGGTDSPANPPVPTPPMTTSALKSHLFLNGSDNYRQLLKEIRRYVASALSPNNPNQHIPTDDEIRHQARWILYDDDDPFNRTPADNAEWLVCFKRSTGILPAADGPGLPDIGTQWQGTSYGLTCPLPAFAQSQVTRQASLDSGNFGTDFGAMTGIETIQAPTIPTAVDSGFVFPSRDFEEKLTQFAVAEVASSGRMPADEAIQARAKEIMGFEVWQAEKTLADDSVLLAKFKVLVVDKVKAVLDGRDDVSSPNQPRLMSPSAHVPERGMDAIDPGLLPALEPEATDKKKNSVSPLPGDVTVAISEEKLDEILKDI